MSTLKPTFCDKTIRHTSKWLILAQKRQKIEFVILKYITYVTTHLGGI